jgi:NAD(P)-dependent dehydrogenase (short-subunit alcohol dehydrogenase family)
MHKEIESIFNIQSKVALVTGGASNLGLDAASILAAAGCNIIITSRKADKAQKAAYLLKDKYGVDSLGIALDQSSYKSVLDCFQISKNWKGKIDIVVNNAGGGSGKSIANLFQRDAAHIQQMIDINLTGMIFCCKEAGKIMHEQGGGKIINIASIAGLLGRDRRMYERSGMNGQPIDYAAAKAGVIGLTIDLAGFLSPMGIYINAISPGGFTGPSREHPQTFIRDYSDRTPIGRMGRDGIDLKGAILFLASPASDYITGQNLIVDGGFSIWH